ncbi:MAG: hypothetical protein E7317_02735 [Clostridiales bacterium]|nr:hypothetical protein [Clostridiales bacterium]
MTFTAPFAVGCIAWLIWRYMHRREAEKTYDEMQQKIRADGYRLGYLTLLGLAILIAFTGEWGPMRFVSPSFALLTAVMLSITLFVMHCIRHDAFFALDQNRRGYTALLAVIVALNGAAAVRLIAGGRLTEGGVVTIESGANLLMAVMFLSILIALALRRRGDDAEDAE